MLKSPIPEPGGIVGRQVPHDKVEELLQQAFADLQEEETSSQNSNHQPGNQNDQAGSQTHPTLPFPKLGKKPVREFIEGFYSAAFPDLFCTGIGDYIMVKFIIVIIHVTCFDVNLFQFFPRSILTDLVEMLVFEIGCLT